MAARTLHNPPALIAGGAVLVLALVGGLVLSSSWNITLPVSLLLGLVVALLVGVTTGGGRPPFDDHQLCRRQKIKRWPRATG